MTADAVVSLLQSAAADALADPLRNSQMLQFPAEGSLFVAGDLHNHRRNFERFQGAANLADHPDRHVILQELIHGGDLGPAGEDRSLDLLLSALQWAGRFPAQVHFLLANHDMAQVLAIPIMKDGYDLTDRFTRHVNRSFAADAPRVHAALAQFFHSIPLAAVTATGIFFAHSLPSDRDLATFDKSILRRDLTDEDWQRNGPVYQLTWGRNQSQEALDKLSKMYYSDLFVCGHQAQEAGSGTIGDRMLLIDSSHNHGSFLPIDLSHSYTLPELAAQATPLASIE